jgi:hypothetical protein
MPIFWADPDTPTVQVKLDPTAYQDSALIRAWSAVPMPADARPSNCSDKNLAVEQVQPDGTVREWEFWRASQAPDGTWTAKWGGATNDVAADRGVASSLAWGDATAPTIAGSASTFAWNVTASSMSMTAGVITRADVASGHINHAVALALTDTAKGKEEWPAQRSVGGSLDTYALPEGSHLRLDPKLDLSTITMTPLVRMIADAAQKYGIVVRDRTYGPNVFMTEEPQPGETNPFTPLLAGQYANAALNAFPWSRLQLLKAATCAGWGACNTPETAAIALNTWPPRVGQPVTLDTTNSVLNQPRAQVRWDLDGDGTYETDAGKAVKETFVPTTAGTRTVRVQITTRAGTIVTGKLTLTVGAA